MVTAVLFDLYETLVTEAPVQPTRASSLGPALGLERDAYRREWKARRPRIVVGALSFADALRQISETLTAAADEAAIQSICEQRVNEKRVALARIDDQITRLVTDLATAGIRLGVISNGFKEDVLPWPGCSLAPAFHCTVFSCDERVAKPDREIYRRALERVGATPEEAIYIGDGGDNELMGAEQAGLRAFRATWFVRHPTVTGTWPELASPQDVLRNPNGTRTQS